MDVSRRESLDVARELGLSERRWDVEHTSQPYPGRNLLEQLLDGRDPDRGEHLFAVGLGQ